jgi:hypothetical protein
MVKIAPKRLRPRVALALSVLALTGPGLAGSAAQAQSFMRTPTLNIESRVPAINPNLAGRAPTVAGRAPNIAGRTPAIADRTPMSRLSGSMAVRPVLPTARFQPNLSTACSAADRGSGGECLESTAEDGSRGKRRRPSRDQRRNGGGAALAAADLRTMTDEIVAEIDGRLSEAQADELARRHGLRRLGSQNFPLIGATIGLFRITDRRSPDAVSRELLVDGSVRSVQPNYRYLLQDQETPLAEGDPAQYALVKLRLPEAHRLAQGANVTIAVIDSGVDLKHPEFAGALIDAFDALGSSEAAHLHGTGIAGVIVSHARLMGGAPSARILAIRAFGMATKGNDKGPESSSYVILKALDYAAAHGAQIVNMSFAGPKDPLIERAVAAVASKDVVMVAAAGNAGPKSPPLYPAANPNVIAVSATDAKDQLLSASNRGSYVAIAAPGADIFLPAPDGKYQMTSGTSFSAAYISASAALMLERNPALKPGEIRAVLAKTARDLGSPGRDDMFGAGEADAYAAVQEVVSPVMSAAPNPEQHSESVPEQAPMRELRVPTPPVSVMATENPATAAAVRPDQQ